MQILFSDPRPKPPFWRKEHGILPLLFALKTTKMTFFCVQKPLLPTLSATSTQYSQREYWSLVARVLEFSSASTQRKCHNSTCFYGITPQPVKYQHVVLFALSTPPKLAKNAPTICFLIFRALLNGQTYKYRVMAKGVPRTREGSKRAEHATVRSGGEKPPQQQAEY